MLKLNHYVWILVTAILALHFNLYYTLLTGAIWKYLPYAIVLFSGLVDMCFKLDHGFLLNKL